MTRRTQPGQPKPRLATPSRALRVSDEQERTGLRLVMGRRVAAARQQVGLSQRALGRLMDRSASWVREVEAGTQWAPAYLLLALSEATGWRVGWFYGGAGKRDTAALVQDLVRVATDEQGHTYANGDCPDQVEGYGTRDPSCPACQAIMRAERALGD